MRIDNFDEGFDDAEGRAHRRTSAESWASPSPARARDDEPDYFAEHEPDPDLVLGYEDDPDCELEPEPKPDELWPRDEDGFAEETPASIPSAPQAPPEALGSPQAGDQGPERTKRRKDKVDFLKGPICLRWVVGALALKKSSKSAITVGLGLWLEVGLERDDFLKRGRSESKPIRIGRKFKRRLGISPSKSSRGISALEAAGLIRIVKGGAGRCPVVVIRNIRIPRPTDRRSSG